LTDSEKNESREIIQFHYTTWPDFGIPSSPCAFLIFLKKVRDSGVLDPDVGPPVIHCSAGIGRSGTFCLVDCCLVLVSWCFFCSSLKCNILTILYVLFNPKIDKEGENKVSVQSILLELRKYRMGLIQTVDQLYFSYQAILEGVKRMNDGVRIKNVCVLSRRMIFLFFSFSQTFDDIADDEVVTQNNKHNNDSDIDEEITPPLPPPRIHSLNNKNIMHSIRPLPSLPQNSSCLLDDILSSDGNSEKERINNLINKEKTIESNNMNRPLPPLPKPSSLAKLDERGSKFVLFFEQIDFDFNDFVFFS
jgi:tyrosine-protein phosphatase non-receptor type 1